ncbi:hypothetical protein [Marinicellulosiphila megalodicopiae]|uniref:hypothetical protein n=1 Tax=Marinicellulosiphila megalodicopiae TaxID=2724896 RepID=UPI003BB01939
MSNMPFDKKQHSQKVDYQKVENQTPLFYEPIESNKIEPPIELIQQLLALQKDLENCIPKQINTIDTPLYPLKPKTEGSKTTFNPFLSSPSLTQLIHKRQEDEQRFAIDLIDLEPIGLPLDGIIKQHKDALEESGKQQSIKNIEAEIIKESNIIIKKTLDEYLPKVEKIIRHRLTLSAQKIIKQQLSDDQA